MTEKKQNCKRYSISNPEVFAEPGRGIVGAACSLLKQVNTEPITTYLTKIFGGVEFRIYAAF